VRNEGTHANFAVPESIRRIADSDDRRLAWEFFVFFSRFEYALKRTQIPADATADNVANRAPYSAGVPDPSASSVENVRSGFHC
jgi:hypothetical protein